MDRYAVQPNNDKGPYRWKVMDYGENKAVALTITRELSENYAEQLNRNGFIEVDA